MGSLILCHAKKARQPYEISRVHKKIFTIEELCYYIYHHIYLVDYTFADHQLCDWISDELELDRLADDLKHILNEEGTLEEFIFQILDGSHLYSMDEIDLVMQDLQNFNEQKDLEKEKFKADQLMNNGEFESAVFLYLKVINHDWDETIDPEFYGRVYASLGSAYGKLFLYDQAAVMYEEAYKYLPEKAILKAYVYSCYMAFPDEKYEDFLSAYPEARVFDEQIRTMVKEAKDCIQIKNADLQIPAWKNNNRGIHKI